MSSHTGKNKNMREALYSLCEKPKSKESPKLKSIPFSLGYIPDPKDSRDYQVSSVLSTSLKTVKNHVDYTNEMSSIKNQWRKGACVGFAIASIIEWQQQQEYLNERKLGSNYIRDDKHYDLSEQWIYHKAKEIDPWPNSEGTGIRYAMKIINKYGVPTENGWPYSDTNIGEPKFWAYSTAKWGLNKNYYRINGLQELKESLSNIGPCAIGVLVFEEFMYPNKGVIKYPSNTNKYYGGHAICVVGYDDNTQFIKFKNSWGYNWGKNGYGYLSYKYIKDFMIDAWVTIDKNVTQI